MTKLWSANRKAILIPQLEVAITFWQRLRGLLGRKNLQSDSAVLFPACNAIHTVGMQFSIDCIFLNKKNEVCKTYSSIKPWKFAGPVWAADSVIELAAGSIERLQIKKGDQLYVGDSLS